MKIVKLNGQRFADKIGKGYYIVTGYALQDYQGFVSFDGIVPYHPTRKALQSILDDGGFTVVPGYVQPMEVN